MPSGKKTPFDAYVQDLLRFLFFRHPYGSMVTALGIYVLFFFLLGPHLKVATNYVVILPLAAAALGFGFWGGLTAGVLGLPANMVIFYLLGLPDSIPENYLVTEISGLVLGAVLGYFSDFFRRLETEALEKTSVEDSLRRALEEKDLLLKEIHHRVKNNLNLLKSLVQLQMNRSGSPDFLECSRGFKQRIYSIALVFDQLYQGNTFETLELRKYLPDLVGHFFQVYPEYRVRWTVEVASPHLSLDVETTTTLGLVVSEILTNILKHGFQNTPAPELNLQLWLSGDDIKLSIKDNGLPWDPQKTASGLGMKIIQALSRQLHGTTEWTREGTANRFLLSWPLHRIPPEEEPQLVENSS